MLMRIYLLLGSTTGEFESHLMGSWEGSLNRLYEKWTGKNWSVIHLFWGCQFRQQFQRKKKRKKKFHQWFQNFQQPKARSVSHVETVHSHCIPWKNLMAPSSSLGHSKNKVQGANNFMKTKPYSHFYAKSFWGSVQAYPISNPTIN